MYVCRHCGYVSHNGNINYCNNSKCRYYGYSYSGDNLETKKPDPPREDLSRMQDGMGEVHSAQRPDFDQRENLRVEDRGDFNEKRESRHGEIFDFLPPETRFFIPEFLNSEIEKGRQGEGREIDTRGMRPKSDAPHGNSMSENEHAMCAMPKSGGMMLGLATVPFQTFTVMYPLDKALEVGTIFPCINMPYNKNIINRG